MKEFLQYHIIAYGDHVIRVEAVLFLLIFVFAAYFISRIVRKIIYQLHVIDEAKKYSIFSLFKYFYFTMVFMIGLRILGFDVTILLAGSAALLVGLGLGIQNLFSDYISGIIILFDNSIKVGDIIETNKLVCKVQEIKLRTSLVLTRDDKYIIIPNTELTKNPVINWTHHDFSARFGVTVSVDYASPIALVRRLMEEAAKEQPQILAEPVPFVRFSEFGESALTFSLFFWTQDVFRVENIKGFVRESIIEKFRTNNINIPFPQRVIHNQ
jgi:small-conductance mechanosensitive channel